MTLVRGALASRNFRLLLACDVVSTFGSAVALVAVPFAVLSIGGSAADVGYVAAAGMAPVIVFLLLGGVIADRLPRQQVMTGANVLQALAQAGSAALVLAGHAHVWELMGLAAVRGVGLGFYFPASAGLLPQTVPEQHRAQANAMDRIGRNAALITGSALGGVLVGVAGPGLGPGPGRGQLRHRGPAPDRDADPGRAPRRAQPDGARAARGLAGVRLPALAVGHRAGVLATGRGVGRGDRGARPGRRARPAGRRAQLGDRAGRAVRRGRAGRAGDDQVPAAAAAADRQPGTAPTSALLFTLAVPLAVPVLAVAAFAAGVCIEVFEVNWATAMQQEIPPAALSRVSAYDAVGSWGLAPVGTVLAGPLALALGTSAVLAAGGVLIVLLTAAVLCVPEVRQLRRRQAPAATGGERVH